MTLAKGSCGTHAKKMQKNSTLYGINLVLKYRSVTGPGNSGFAVMGNITFYMEKSLKPKQKPLKVCQVSLPVFSHFSSEFSFI